MKSRRAGRPDALRKALAVAVVFAVLSAGLVLFGSRLEAHLEQLGGYIARLLGGG
ncbi:MAG: hypothetical protein V2A58_07315 [Planctomycetota bacterium]